MIRQVLPLRTPSRYLATERPFSRVASRPCLVWTEITSAQSWPAAFGGAFGINLNTFLLSVSNNIVTNGRHLERTYVAHETV